MYTFLLVVSLMIIGLIAAIVLPILLGGLSFVIAWWDILIWVVLALFVITYLVKLFKKK